MTKHNNGGIPTFDEVVERPRGTGPGSGGQSGDTQGLPEGEEELLEEGQAFEAGITEGVEEFEDEEVKEVRTRQIPEDDVPAEYLGND